MSDTCTVDGVEASLGGQLTVAALSLEHYAIASTLGDPLPDELRFVLDSNAVHASLAARSDQVLFFASLDCLHEVPASDPGWTARCLADADAWLEAGAKGFKDHAGKSWDGSGEDVALWVGAYNRLAGWCDVDAGDPTPNRACQAQATARMPLDEPAWRELVRGLVETRAVPLVTHAVDWREADTRCGRSGSVGPCFTQAADALVDFATWAERELSVEARRRIVVAHLGFLDKDEARLTAVLEAGLTVDLTQTALASSGCLLRDLVAAYPEQVVLGTDVEVGAACMPRHYEAWLWGLLGDADRRERYPDTCRGTMEPVGAGLLDELACDVEVRDDAARLVLYDNAARLLGWQP
ncbi:MAG: hypothetical protein IT383_20100 [Deltaproteobacteria bacterium]|nr:hypothetical protein [Deltaproteobacteria bacterium]